MPEVHDITSTVQQTSRLKKFATRTTVVALAGTAVAALVLLKTRKSNDETPVETPAA
jgi:hypothetical protein